MFGKFAVDLDLSIFKLLLIGLIIYLSFQYYKSTVPQVSKRIRHMLRLVRLFAIIILCFLLLKPILRLSYKKTEPSISVALLDASKSMELKEGDVSYIDHAESIYNKYLSGLDIKMEKYYFGGEISDSNTPQNETDISSVIMEIVSKYKGKNLESINLLSDGNYNSGINPATLNNLSPVPVHTFEIGKSFSKNDIALKNIDFREICFAGKEFPIGIDITNTGFDPESTSLNISINSKPSISKEIILPKAGMVSHTDIPIKIEKEGNYEIKIKLTPLENEITIKNNSRNISIKVLKTKSKVLLAANMLNFDYRFIKEALENNPDRQVNYYYQLGSKTIGQVYTDSLETYDTVILFNFHKLSPAFSSALKKYLDEGGSVILIGNNSHIAGIFNAKSPAQFKTKLSNPEQIFAHTDYKSIDHPLLMVYKENPEGSIDFWNNIPPLNFYGASMQMNENSNTILYSKDKSKSLITYKITGSSKIVMINFLGFYRTAFGDANEIIREGYNNFWDNLVSWTANKENSKRFRIKTEKQNYTQGEAVTFLANLYKENYEPVNGAAIKIILESSDTESEFFLEESIDFRGSYKYSINNLIAGKYQYIASTPENSNYLPQTGEFFIEPYSIEYERLGTDPLALKKISENSGGVYFDESNIDKIGEFVKNIEKEKIESVDIRFYNDILLYLLAAFLLCVEWFIRKRKGLA